MAKDERASDSFVSALDNIATKLANVHQRPAPPRFGPAPVDENGNARQPDAIFVDRDGKEYQCLIEHRRENKITYKGQKGHTMMPVYRVRVNFANKGQADWKTVDGVCMYSDLKNVRNKRFLKPIEKQGN